MIIYQDTTNEFSFLLKPSQYGVGVFATHGIKKGTHLRLFGDKKLYENRSRLLDEKDVPKIFRDYCVYKVNKKLACPKDFGGLSVGWYLNHSKNPNATRKDYNWYAKIDIKDGEEIFVNYNELNEPEEEKEDYYKN